MDSAFKRAPVMVNPVVLHPEQKRLSLSGTWNFRLDPDDRGIKEKWFNAPLLFTEELEVPGTWQGQGFGNDEKETMWDFGFEVRSLKATYTGTGWYQKYFKVPSAWKGKRIWLNIGGAHPSAEVWVNGQKAGENHSPFVPFGFDITGLVHHDSDNLMVIRIHEQARIMGFVYNWRGNWSGLYRDVELSATGNDYIEHFWLNPSIRGKLKVRFKGGMAGSRKGAITLQLKVTPLTKEGSVIEDMLVVKEPGQWDEIEIDVPSPELWSPENPFLYRIDALLKRDDVITDAVADRFGFVDLSTKGKHILINNEPYYIRQSCDHFCTPEMGCPDADRKRWYKKLSMLHDYGYNAMRLPHAFGPEFYDAADEVGILVQSDMSMLGSWGGKSIWHDYQWPQPMPDMYEAIKWQWDHVVMRDVNHPSANIYCMSNEFGWEADATKLEVPYPRIAWRCYHDTKAVKPSSLVIYTDGGYRDDMPLDFVNDDVRIDDKINKPLINHEFRWWSSFPDVRIIKKFRNTAIRPIGQELALQAAAKYGITHVLPKAAENSQRLQLIEAKTKIESSRRDYPNLAGIEHTNAMDVPMSPQGVLDEFYEKKYVDSETWISTNSDTVILSGFGFDNRVFASGNTFECPLYVSDFSHPELKKPKLSWKAVNSKDQAAIKEGILEYEHKAFRTIPAGSISFVIPELNSPAGGILEAELSEDGRKFRNSWNFWMFPSKISIPASVRSYGETKYTWVRNFKLGRAEDHGPVFSNSLKAILVEKLDGKCLEFAKSGGTVILAASEGLVRPMRNKGTQIKGEQYFNTPPAHYPPHEDGHDGTILAEHPVFGDFPHEGFADLQFYRMIFNTPAIDLEALGLNSGDPAFRQMHSYSVCRPLSYLINAAIGKGGLIICALNLDSSFPEARYLFSCICRYAVSGRFKPDVVIDDDTYNRIKKGTDVL